MEKINSKDNFIAFVKQYQNLVFSICLKLTGDYFAAEDLTQETFLSAYQHQEEFDGKNEKAWICRIASNKCIDYQKAAARRMIPTMQEDLPEVAMVDENEPLQMVLNQEIMQEFGNYCSVLSPPYNEIARLYFLEGKSAKDIAEQFGINVHTVQTQIYRAREKLKKVYRKELL